VRLALFAAMAAMLVVSLCVPEAFADNALLFACAYAAFRYGQIWLFYLASRDDAHLRHSVGLLLVSTSIGCGFLVAAAFTDGALQGVLWVVALVLDMGGPYVYDSSGWKLVPGHFAERHGLIVLIALGESIVAIGAGANAGVTAGVVVAAILGIAVASVMWWLYFDVVAMVAGRRLASAAVGREQNAMARDSYSYLHFPMVAGIVLAALGLKKTLAHVDHPLALVPAAAMLGGYLLAHVAFRYRHIQSVNHQRLAGAAVLLALIPLATEISALALLATVTAILAALVAVESFFHGRYRARLRAQLATEPVSD
jgi:low temperature requirement protein LtrA